MHIIGQGMAGKHGSGIWTISDQANALLTEFNHALFPHIVDGTAVYFVDLDLDPKFCDNVQTKFDVDRLVLIATPTNGFQNGVELRLRSYIMDALLVATSRTGSSRSDYLQELEEKMKDVRANGEAAASGKATVALLKKMAISG